ncbi:hypothetical protein CRI94_05130 [Longibacter salinarum]|uniref:Uncharacterized protein n=1 Tax=Longibacter salinarum TaxID=1850348 RepID=A0A2A8D0E3_9BACT|nr:hypothetical protein [Longibacter salinarum]PEN14415.1 hypothetical protein CRI94_05130 [Longibacter salinarum]
MFTRDLIPFAFVCALGFALFGTGCDDGKGTPPDVPTGRFEVRVEGAMDRTFTGEARYRLVDGDLAGFELVIDSTSGLSIDVEKGPIRRKTYQVVEWQLMQVERPGGPPGAMAFLETPDAAFEARNGTIQVTYTGEEAIGGKLSLTMEGSREGVPEDTHSIRAEGEWTATQLLVD